VCGSSSLDPFAHAERKGIAHWICKVGWLSRGEPRRRHLDSGVEEEEEVVVERGQEAGLE